MNQNRSGFRVESLDRRLLLSGAVKEIVDSIGAARRGVDPIAQPVITEKLPESTVNLTQPKTRYGVGNPFEVNETGGPHSSEYNTGSGKWFQEFGLGAPVMLSYSFSNLLSSGLTGLTTSQIRAAVIEGLSLWSAVVPIRFFNANDSGPTVIDDTDYVKLPGDGIPDIRIGEHGFDGPSGALAHAWYPEHEGVYGLRGDIHFDNGETWSVDPDDSGFDLIEVATHEIGHALGLAHSDTTASVMYPYYQALFDGPDTGFLMADDIDGIRSVYGNGFGYVLDSGTLYLSGTQGDDLIYIKRTGDILQLERDGLVSHIAAADVLSIQVRGRGGNDILRVEDNAGKETYLYGNDGDDFIDFSYDSRDLDNVTGFTATFGGNGLDRIFVYDDNSLNDTYNWDSAQLARAGFGGVYYGAGIEEMALVTGTTDNTVNILSTRSGTDFVLQNASGTDSVFIGNTINGVQDILGAIYIIDYDNGLPAFTNLDIDDTGNTQARSAKIRFSGTQYEYLSGLAPATIYFDQENTNALHITTGSGDDTIGVDANSAFLFLDSAGGHDTIQIGDSQYGTGRGMDLITDTISIINSNGLTHLILNDSWGGTGRNATWYCYPVLSNTAVYGLLQAGSLSYSQVSSVDIWGSQFDDTYTFNDTFEVTTVDTWGGSDQLLVNSTEAGGWLTVNTGSGDDDVLKINEDNTGIATAELAATDEVSLLSIGVGGRLNMDAGADITLRAGGPNILTSGVRIDGVLDLADNSFVRRFNLLNQPDFVPSANKLRNGYNGGLWNGAAPSIISSVAANASVAGDSVGYAFASQTSLGSLNGIALHADDLVVRYTLEGDANLDRAVNFADLLRLSQNYGKTGRMWSEGNFDYDAANNVSFPDLLKLSQRYGASLVTAYRTMRSNDNDPLWKQVIA